VQLIVRAYQGSWPQEFEQEAAGLRTVFGDQLVDIEHIGSTAVPGLTAKPIIDMIPVVRDIQLVDELNPQMVALGYEPLGEFGLPGRRYFRKGGDERTHHAHVYEMGNSEIQRHLAFRDYLRTHPADARRYGDLKTRLAAAHPDNWDAYMDGKDAFVKALEAEALKWYAQQEHEIRSIKRVAHQDD